jgi:hypothetical protein
VAGARLFGNAIRGWMMNVFLVVYTLLMTFLQSPLLLYTRYFLSISVPLVCPTLSAGRAVELALGN